MQFPANYPPPVEPETCESPFDLWIRLADELLEKRKTKNPEVPS